jgi:transposase
MEQKTNRNPHRKYDDQFKSEAIKQVNSGRSVPEVAKALGITDSLLYQWFKKASSLSPNDALDENAQLRKQLKQLETERDILKKALAIFSRVP